jgi:hypothetical protein
LLAAAEPDAGANRGVDKEPPSQGRRRLREHAAAVADREAVELLWAVAAGVELRGRRRRRGLGLAWQMCDDGVAPARLIPRLVRVLGGAFGRRRLQRHQVSTGLLLPVVSQQQEKLD